MACYYVLNILLKKFLFFETEMKKDMLQNIKPIDFGQNANFIFETEAFKKMFYGAVCVHFQINRGIIPVPFPIRKVVFIRIVMTGSIIFGYQIVQCFRVIFPNNR